MYKNSTSCVTHSKVYYSLNFEGARSQKGLILSSQKGLLRSFQLPKKRGHPACVPIIKSLFLTRFSDRPKRAPTGGELLPGGGVSVGRPPQDSLGRPDRPLPQVVAHGHAKHPGHLDAVYQQRLCPQCRRLAQSAAVRGPAH